MSMKQNIVLMIPLMESTTEPFQSMGLHPRSSATDTHPQITIVNFMNCSREFVRAGVEVPENKLTKKNDSQPKRNQGTVIITATIIFHSGRGRRRNENVSCKEMQGSFKKKLTYLCCS
ncbi:hypothetical protein Aduo_018924 [Ancylostoma duodenale]